MTYNTLGIVAQSVEQFAFNELVSGSSPDDPTGFGWW